MQTWQGTHRAWERSDTVACAPWGHSPQARPKPRALQRVPGGRAHRLPDRRAKPSRLSTPCGGRWGSGPMGLEARRRVMGVVFARLSDRRRRGVAVWGPPRHDRPRGTATAPLPGTVVAWWWGGPRVGLARRSLGPSPAGARGGWGGWPGARRRSAAGVAGLCRCHSVAPAWARRQRAMGRAGRAIPPSQGCCWVSNRLAVSSYS